MNRKQALSDVERIDWLRLIRSENVGPVTFAKLIERYGSAKSALEALPALAERGGRKITIGSASQAEDELAAAAKAGAMIVASCEPDYPPLLSLIESAPPVLFVLGHSHLLKKKSVALVGARNASINGCRISEALARDLSEGGLLVVSGMARGIDAAAHRGALENGTVAVMAGGVDQVYPRENEALYGMLKEQGALLSESPMGTTCQARHFPSRNRIISGMSRGVVVVEAALRSGSLITARLAAEYGRDVFAVPGSPADSRARGANQLIKNGAILIEKAEDILSILRESFERPLAEPEVYAYKGPPPEEPTESLLNSARSLIHRSLSSTPVDVDDILRDTGQSASVVATVLLELELAGKLERHSGNKVSLLSESAQLILS